MIAFDQRESALICVQIRVGGNYVGSQSKNVTFATRKLATRTVGKALPQPIMIRDVLNFTF
jgi:hypothetical protein